MTRVSLLIVLALVPVAAQTPVGPVLSDAPGAQRLAFDAVSIKTNRTNAGVPGMTAPPGRFTATNMWVRFVIQNAWGVRDDEITGGPDWLTTDRFDIIATTGGAVGQRESMAMLRSMLEDRFKLVARMETRQEPIYALVMARDDRKLGPDIRLSSVDCKAKRDACGASRSGFPAMTMRATGWPVSTLVSQLPQWVGRPVDDATGLAGAFDFSLTFVPETTPRGPGAAIGRPAATLGAVTAAPSADAGTSLFTALQEQLGLRLEPRRGLVEMLVIDAIERPTDD